MPQDDPRRRHLRLPFHDCATPGAYYVTICTAGRRALLSTISHRKVEPTAIGAAVADTWSGLPTRFPHVALDTFVLMPNHIHGVLVFTASGPALPTVVGAFKSLTTRAIPPAMRPLWQRNYYEHVVRQDADLDRIRTYIAANPTRWPRDPDNPNRTTPADPQDPRADLPP